MRKKYLVKHIKNQPHVHLDCQSMFNSSAFPEAQGRRSHTRSSRPMMRLRTEPDQGENGLLKKRQSSLSKIRKVRYYMPGNNKQNIKLSKDYSGTRLTYNEHRASQMLETAKERLDTTTLGNNRFSESKYVHKRAMPKINKLQSCKLTAPKLTNKINPTKDSVQIYNIKQLGINNRQQPRKKELLNSLEVVKLEDVIVDQQIGSGTFGKVYSGRIKSSGDKVAVKRVQQDKKYKTRQLEIVRMLKSPFIVKVLGTFTTDQGKGRHQYLNIIMETFEENFFELLRRSGGLSKLDIKLYAYQMLRGLVYLHDRKICHRDLKPQNMLVTKKRLVICDFGSAKILNPNEQNISYICSRCYRAPELIFQSTEYTTQIDMWSIGCIFLEILNGRPLFIADSSLNHILEVIKVLGTPSRQDVRSMNPNYEINEYDLPHIKRKQLKKLFPNADPLYLDLTEKIIKYAPEKRLTAVQALAHPFFDELREQTSYKGGKFDEFQYLLEFQETLTKEQAQKLIPKWMK